MKLAEVINPFLRMIPKEESPESANFILKGGNLSYSGIRTACSVNFIDNVEAVIGMKDLRSLGSLDVPTATRDGNKLVFSDAKTTWTIFAPMPPENAASSIELPDDLTLEPLPDVLIRGRSLFSVKGNSVSVDGFVYEGETYVAATSPHLVMSVRSEKRVPLNVHITKNSDVFESLVLHNAKVGFKGDNLYSSFKVHGSYTVTSVMRLMKSRAIQAAEKMVHNLHAGNLEKGLIIPCEIAYDEMREVIGIIERMDSPTQMTIKIEDGKATISVSEMFGKSFSRVVNAKTSEKKITIRSSVLPQKLLSFMLDASGKKPHELKLLFNVMPETRVVTLRPVTDRIVENVAAVFGVSV